ncbi:MAG: trimeric autotransporter adhesin [Clostridiales bacterium]|jgi:LPXTG-motif cell wall-anchored protein|nr:trimeric autotransporter adhesin [Clostridiales bacterium]
MIERLSTILLCLCFVFFSVPVSGAAVEGFVVQVLEGNEGGFTYSSGVLTFASDGAYEVSMADGVDVTTDVIAVASGVTAEVRINGLNIDLTDLDRNAISVAPDSECELILIGANSLAGRSVRVSNYLALIHVPLNSSLVIDGDGQLTLRSSLYGAGIGGNGGAGEGFGSITINSGEINVTGIWGAGIGGGGRSASYSGSIIINDGEINAISDNGAAIGGGSGGSGGSIVVNDGLIYAESKTGAAIGGGMSGDGEIIAINGGFINATNTKDGAGIGGGSGGSGGSISFNGGNTTILSNFGAGIGGGLSGNGGQISINSGSIFSTSFWGAGIGGGRSGNGGSITIVDGEIETDSTSGAGIGGGDSGNGADVYISGGSIYAQTNSSKAEHIGHGNNAYSDDLSSGVILNKPAGLPLYLTVFDTGYGEAMDLPVDAFQFSGVAEGYGTMHLRTNEDGKLFFYLPFGEAKALFDNDLYSVDVQTNGINTFEAAPPMMIPDIPSDESGDDPDANTPGDSQPGNSENDESQPNDNSNPPSEDGNNTSNVPKLELGANESLLTVDANSSSLMVQAKMDKSVYPEPVKLSVKMINGLTADGRSKIETAQQALLHKLVAVAPVDGKAAKIQNMLLLDLSLLTQTTGQEVQPVDGNVTITVPLPTGYDAANTVIAHFLSDGSVEFLDTLVKDGWITFVTSSFSPYAIIELDIPVSEAISVQSDQDAQESNVSTDDNDTLPADADQLPKTGEDRSPFSSFALILAMTSLLAALIFLKRKIFSEK